MAATVTPWLWDLLDWNCGVDEGRLALLPDNTVVSSFKVMSETGTLHQIKTISSGCSVDVAEEVEEEESVVRVSARRRGPDDQLEYETRFADGHSEWLLAHQFIDADGTVNDAWLSFSDRNDLQEAFGSFTLKQLKVLLPSIPVASHILAGDECISRLEVDWRQASTPQTRSKAPSRFVCWA